MVRKEDKERGLVSRGRVDVAPFTGASHFKCLCTARGEGVEALGEGLTGPPTPRDGSGQESRGAAATEGVKGRGWGGGLGRARRGLLLDPRPAPRLGRCF